MAAGTIQKLSDDAFLELKRSAKAKARSTESDMREILEKAARPDGEINIAVALAEFDKKYRKELSQIDFESMRDKSEIQAAVFE